MTTVSATGDQSDTSGAPQWWLAVDGEPRGPYSEAYVRTALESGKLPDDALLCPVGEKSWRPLVECAEFADGLKPSAQGEDGTKATASGWSHLPMMGRVLCVYAIGVYPGLTALSFLLLCAGGTYAAELPPDALIRDWAIMLDALSIVVDAAIATLFVFAGLQFRKLRRSGLSLLQAALAASLAWSILCMAIMVVWEALVTLAYPDIELETLSTPVWLLWAALAVTYLAVLAFEAAALLWLFLRGRSLPLTNA